MFSSVTGKSPLIPWLAGLSNKDAYQKNIYEKRKEPPRQGRLHLSFFCKINRAPDRVDRTDKLFDLLALVFKEWRQ